MLLLSGEDTLLETKQMMIYFKTYRNTDYQQF